MAYFFCRIQLRGEPSESTYEQLHAAMTQTGFSRTIVSGSDSKTRKLPHAMYTCESVEGTQSVYDKALAVAKLYGTNPIVLVIRSADYDRWWGNMDFV